MHIIYSSLREYPPKVSQQNFVPGHPIRLGHVGRVTGGKGQIEAIRACQILYSKNIPFRLTCVGEVDQTYAATIHGIIEKLPHMDSIKLTGFRKNLGLYYNNADIFILPSKGEGLSNAFIEALSHELICIASNNTSFPELKDIGFGFFLAQDNNPNDLKMKLSLAVQQFLDNPTRLKSNVELELFNPDREVREFSRLLV